MIKKIDIGDREWAQRVLAIQIPAYQAEAEVIQFYDLPPLRETVEDLQRSHEIFYGYFLEDELVGALSYKIVGKTLDIHRLMVEPSHFRKGIGQALLKFVESIEKECQEIIVSTGQQNMPARQLYLRSGFREAGTQKVSEGIVLSQFWKSMKPGRKGLAWKIMSR